MNTAPTVGTLGEKALHADLKRWYSRAGDLVEHPVDGFVVDIVRGATLIEIQTRNVSSVRHKLRTLAASHPIRLVHPVSTHTRLVKVADAGEVLSTRTSPRHGSAVDVAAELVSIPDLLVRPGFCVDVVLVTTDEVRRYEVGRAWRRRGWVVVERHLRSVVGTLRIDEPHDLLALLPPNLPDEFTTADLAHALQRPRRLAQQLAYCLRRAGVVEPCSKDGNALRYRRVG